jgi:hypothetical protein
MARNLDQWETKSLLRSKDIEVGEIFSNALMTISVGLYEPHFLIARRLFGSTKDHLYRRGHHRIIHD